MKKFSFFRNVGLLFTLASVCVLSSCSKDEEPTNSNEPVASFQFAVSESNFLEVTFSNFSQNAASVAWDFGDDNTSAESDPVHTYAETGTYTVTLTATGADGSTNAQSKDVTISDPDEQLTLLAGLSSKSWILQREGTALGIGPAPSDVQWWGFGSVTPLYERPCILDDTYTFHRDGTFENNTNGTFFMDSEANGGWNDSVNSGEGCTDETTDGAFTSAGAGGDMSVFANGGSYSFDFDPSSNTLDVVGAGAYIGLTSKSNAGDLTKDGTPAASYSYEVVRLAAGDVADTLELAMQVNGEANYWNFWLVSYHNAADMPAIPTPPADVNVTFSVDMSEHAGFTNVYVSGGFNGWSGTANPMTDDDSDGIYDVTLAIASNTDHEYKFSVDDWADSDQFTADDACAVSSDATNYNRGITTTTSDVSIATVCFNSCDVCGGTVAPTTMGHTFVDAAGADLLSLIGGASTITLGQDDPVDAANAKVGRLDRVADNNFQEAILSLDPQENFSLENMNTLSIEVYVPSSNDFTGSLANYLVIGFGDQTETPPNWWEDHNQWEVSDIATDQWVTLTYDLTTPHSGGSSADPTTRVDLDMLFIGFGGGNHGAAGHVFIRNLELKFTN